MSDNQYEAVPLKWPLVGRQAELREFQDALTMPTTLAVIIHGRPGVGKSRLAEECLKVAGTRGHRIMTATATVAAGEFPLGAVAHLMPFEKSPADPVATFNAVAAALRGKHTRGKGQEPAVLFVDDFHHLDKTTVVLLGQLLQAGLIFLLATVRPEEAAHDLVESLGCRDAMHHIDLGEFTRDQSFRVLESVLGKNIEHGTSNEIIRTSGGNILFMKELVTGAIASGALTRQQGIWKLSGPLMGTTRLVQTIRRRLLCVPQAHQPALDSLALCGELSLDTLIDLVPKTAVEQLELAGVIEVSVDRRRISYRLAHPIYGEVIRGQIAHERKRNILQKHTRNILRHGARRRNDKLKVATWQLMAGDEADHELLTSAALLARYARDYHTAAKLIASIDPSRLTSELLLIQGEAYHHTASWRKAERALKNSQKLSRSEDQYLAATIARTTNTYWGIGDTIKTFQVIENARARVDSEGSRQMLRISEAGYILYTHGTTAALRLLADADQSSIPRIRIWGMLQKSLALAYSGNTEKAINLGLNLHREGIQTDEQQQLLEPSHHASGYALFRMVALTEAGNLSEARSLGNAFFTQAVDAKAIELQIWFACSLGRCEILTGRLRDARRWFIEALSLATENNHIRSAVVARAGLAIAAAQLGEADEAEAALSGIEKADVAHHLPTRIFWHASKGWAKAATGDLHGARRVLLEGAGIASSSGYLTYEGWLLTEVARLGGAKQVNKRLIAIARETDAPLLKARSSVASAMANEDPYELLAAAHQCQFLGAHLLAAETAVAAAAKKSINGSTDASEANAVFRSAIVECEGAKTPGLFMPHQMYSLTAREREIALMAAHGLTSSTIASQLSLSVRTVDNHLQRVYGKLGISSRRALEMFAYQFSSGSGD